ncbi:MAG: hypothetical protein WD469_04860 [Paenibacillaceae bacterium]
MKPNGFDRSQKRQKWRCPPACGCSTTKYGRTHHTHSKDNLRLFPKTIRGSEKWKLIYKTPHVHRTLQQAGEGRLQARVRQTPFHQDVVYAYL